MPASELAIETVAQIVEDFVGPFRMDPLGHEECRFTASLVSKTWRSATLCTHSLWACAYIDNYTPAEFIRDSLSKAGGLSIHLHFEFVHHILLAPKYKHTCDTASVLARCAHVLAYYLPRCASFTLDTADPRGTTAAAAFVPWAAMTTLKHVNLRLHPTSGWEIPAVMVNGSTWSTLVVARYFPCLPRTLIISLTRIYLANVNTDNTPHLTHLFMTHCHSDSDFPHAMSSEQDVTLSSLVHLRVRLDTNANIRLLSRLICPAVVTLHLVVRGFFTILKLVYDSCVSVLQNAEHLILDGPDYSGNDFLQLLAAVPHLRLLDVSQCGTPVGWVVLHAVRLNWAAFPLVRTICIPGSVSTGFINAVLPRGSPQAPLVN
ncbi:hypothetical protein DFH07DRAFT_971361 [Mycena maculata]|uniref:F-box domain-containing protein n=1 Tax=Mycena maculata TaxID=230809 RepID=A0AAD7HMM5_9AGAR|nr:hypothetical protein DFH07DRAFT_971361 [Mycena maculata]